MPLTPADVHNVVFKKPPIGKRGYDEDEVDAFLDEVEAELGQLVTENTVLRDRVTVLEAAPPPATDQAYAAPITDADTPPPPNPPEDILGLF